MNLTEIIKSGGENGFKALYEAYHNRIYFFALKSTQSESEAEDLTQNIFLKIWENKARLSLTIPLESQIFTTARNLLIDHYRTKTAQQKLLFNYFQLNDNNASDHSPSSEQEKMATLQKAIEALPNKRREIFKLSKLHGLTYEEIADELSISKNTVHVQISKALQTLRRTVRE